MPSAKLRGVAWIDLYKPSEEELESVAKEFNLPPLAVEELRGEPCNPAQRQVGGSAHRVTVGAPSVGAKHLW